MRLLLFWCVISLGGSRSKMISTILCKYAVRWTFRDADQLNWSYLHGRVSFTRRVGCGRHDICRHSPGVRKRPGSLISDCEIQSVPESQTPLLHYQHSNAVCAALCARTLRILRSSSSCLHVCGYSYLFVCSISLPLWFLLLSCHCLSFVCFCLLLVFFLPLRFVCSWMWI